MNRHTRRTFLKGLGAGLGAAFVVPAAASAAGGKLFVARASAAGVITLDPTLPVHPMLQYGAIAEPDKKVRVIVTRLLKQDSAKEIAKSADADLDEDFDFVKAHVMTVQQRKVLQLAKNKKVAYISPDTSVRKHGVLVDASKLATVYPKVANVDDAWNGGPQATGRGVKIAVIDTGANVNHPDLRGRVQVVNVNPRSSSTADNHGHGTHVAGIVAGRSADGKYIGTAPEATVYAIKISDDAGDAQASDLLRGLQWVYDNRASTGIKVVNLSITAGTPESYKTSAVAAAAEQLWMAGITVIVAAGNRGTDAGSMFYAPANDPYVITVGALDDGGTLDAKNDTLAIFSSRGTTQDGFAKPDVVVSGRRIVAPLASTTSKVALQFPDRITTTPAASYIRLSGTSMAAPQIAGVVALALQRNPNLTPNQVKALIKSSQKKYPGQTDNAGLIDGNKVAASATGSITPVNAGLVPNLGIDAATGAVNWGQTYWDQTYWDQTYWDQTYWDQTYWDQTYWD